jgi:hypothetical protein
MNARFTLFALGLLIAASAHTQEFPYTLTVFNEEYVALGEATTLDEGIPWDDPEWIVPIGFPFTYMDETFTEFYLNAPGSQLLPFIEENEVSVLIPYFADIMNASLTEFVSPVRYVTEGEPGFRICKIEWSNVGFWQEGIEFETFFNTTNFQLWVYESTNDFEIRFGANTIKDGGLVHFFGQPTILLGKNVELSGETWEALWTLSGDPANPAVTPITTLSKMGLTADQILNGEPANGQVYHFDTGIVSVGEITESEAWSLYPTLAQDEVMIQNAQKENLLMTVYDLSGRIAAQWTAAPGTSRHSLDQLASGAYVVRSADNHTTRFIKSGN